MTKYSFRKDLESINSCTTAMGQEGTEVMAGTTGSQEPLGWLMGVLWQETTTVELASGLRRGPERACRGRRLERFSSFGGGGEGSESIGQPKGP